MKRTLKSYPFIIASVIAVCLGLVAADGLYQNSKTDGFNSGSFKVAKCQEKNYDWKIYECTGNYTHGVGDMGKNNALLTITGHKPEEGEVVADVYPPLHQQVMKTNRFVTGKERSSVLYNLPWLVMMSSSIFLPVGAVLYLLGRQSRNGVV